uniref:ATP-dependent RNA helicase A isoform X5 n=1 Tax=Gasterosteus aculeatus aculeatus TaxID=481459 RepID=UPI001A981242|nr:ATP-dependent RNA helicase A isoform X5 [Gasterosteus aculeatus aculeatus]
MADIKNFLYAWCGKKKLTPSYDIRAVGNKNRQKFMCEVRVDTYNYIGMGNSTNKKDAQTNAARDFVNYLVRIGEMNAAEVPAPGVSASGGDQPHDDGGPAAGGGAGVGFGSLPSSGPLPPHLVLKTEKEEAACSGPIPGVTGLGYSGGRNSGWGGGGGGGGAEWERGANLKEYYVKRDEQEAQATLESEEVDLNASLHGNWTLENAKARLNQFFQKEKTSAEYKYSQVGPDHNRADSSLPHSPQVRQKNIQLLLLPRELHRRDAAVCQTAGKKDHGARARLQQEAGGPVVRPVSGPAAVPPGGPGGLLRGHQEEGGRDSGGLRGHRVSGPAAAAGHRRPAARSPRPPSAGGPLRLGVSDSGEVGHV